MLERLWLSVPPATVLFEPGMVDAFPAPAKRYLLHTIAPGTPLYNAVRLEMTGELQLKGVWSPFRATQVIVRDRGFVWKATVWSHHLPIVGHDRLVDGAGDMRWRLLGLFPVVSAHGPDIARSAAGRMHSEAIWLPSTLLQASWEPGDPTHAPFTVAGQGHTTRVELTLGDNGALLGLGLNRWGAPEGAAFRELPFGGTASDDRTFSGVTLPTRYRVGWHYGADRFDRDGAFFRCTLSTATWR